MNSETRYHLPKVDAPANWQGSASFIRFTGLFAAIVLLYAASLHIALIVATATRSNLLPRLMTPSPGVIHAIVCMGGAALAFVFIWHSLKNPLLNKRSRVLWLPAIACGYGLIFYWYHHVWTGTRK